MLTKSATQTPRGIRNNNPGNIEHGAAWVGLSDEQPDSRFARFDTPEHGIRAMARILHTYRNRHGLRTIRGVISRWAPAHENDTTRYIEHVAQAANKHPDDIINTRDYPAIIKAMIKHENGQQPYSDKIIKKGIALA